MGSTAQTFTQYRRHRNNLPFKMRFIIALALFTVVIARPDGHGWGQQQQHQQPTNVEYGPWVAQDNYQRDSKGIISHVATFISQIYSSGIVGEVRLGKSITFSEAADEVLEAI